MRPSNALISNINEAIKFSNKRSWWSFNGMFDMLHKYNLFRLEYISKYLANELYSSKGILEIGCGGGIMSLPLSLYSKSMNVYDLNAENYQFIDFISKNIKEYQNSCINYRCKLDASEEIANEKTYDVILVSEVLEHVTEKEQFLNKYCALLKDKGILIITTISKTLKSMILHKVMAEYVLRIIEKDTHDWNLFIKPESLISYSEKNGLIMQELCGVSYSPITGRFQRVETVNGNYIIIFKKL